MKKLVFLSLFMFVLTAGAAWCVGWYMQARQAREWVQAQMAAFDPALGTLKAESVTVGGFPARLTVTLHNPSATLHLKPVMSQLYRRLMALAGNSAGVLTAPEYPEGTLTRTLHGTMSFSINALSDRLSIASSGASTNELVQPGASSAYSTESSGTTLCSLQLERNVSRLLSQMWSVGHFLDWQSWLGDVQAFDCTVPESTTTDIVSGSLLLSSGPASLGFSSRHQGDQHRSRLALSMDHYEIFPAGDPLVNQWRRLLTPVSASFVPFTMSLYGAQSLAFEAEMETPGMLIAEEGKPWRFDMKRLELKNQASQSQGHMMVSSAPADGKDQGTFDIAFVSTFSPVQSQAAKSGVQEFVTTVMQEPALAARTSGTTPEQLEALAFDALPNISAMGTLTQKIRGSFANDRTARATSFTIAELELSSRDFGLLGAATGSAASGQILPVVDASLTCRQCLPMIDVLGAYLMRVEKAAPLFFPVPPGSIAWTPSEVEGLKKLLAAIGIPTMPQGTDLQFTVKSDGITLGINGKPLHELLALLQQFLGAAATAPVTAP